MAAYVGVWLDKMGKYAMRISVESDSTTGHLSMFSFYLHIPDLFLTQNSCAFLLQLIGCALLGVGIWLHLSKGAYASMAPSFNFLSVTAVCIAAGAVMLVVAFFGCCGAIMENQCLLLTVGCFKLS